MKTVKLIRLYYPFYLSEVQMPLLRKYQVSICNTKHNAF